MIEFLVFSLFLLIGSYFYISYKEHTYINVLSFGILIFIAANYILPLFYSYFVQSMVLSLGLVYVYVTYLAVTLVFMFSYHFHYALPIIKTRDIVPQYYSLKLKIIAIVLLSLAWLIYAPILIHFKEYLLHPRAIYTATRGGYGQYYFISLFFANSGLIVAFFAFKRIKLFMYMSIYFAFAYFHGSKGVMIWGIGTFILFKIYALNVKVSFKSMILYGTVFSIAMMLTFYLTMKGINDLSILLRVMAGYSDYTRNAAFLINHYSQYFNDFHYGLLQFQNEFYSRIPRFIDPDKPRAFGSLILAKEVFPEWFSKNVGDASFGMVGTAFADFGYFAIFYLMFLAFIKGVFLRWTVDAFKKTKNIFYFILLLFAAGFPLMSLGLGHLVFIHFIMAIFVMNLFATRYINIISIKEIIK